MFERKYPPYLFTPQQLSYLEEKYDFISCDITFCNRYYGFKSDYLFPIYLEFYDDIAGIQVEMTDFGFVLKKDEKIWGHVILNSDKFSSNAKRLVILEDYNDNENPYFNDDEYFDDNENENGKESDNKNGKENDKDNDRKDILRVLKDSPDIRELYFFKQFEGTVSFPHVMKNLTVLNVAKWGGITSEELKFCPNLVSLKLNDCKIESHLSFKSLQEISLFGSDFESFKNIHAPNITSITLTDVEGFNSFNQLKDYSAIRHLCVHGVKGKFIMSDISRFKELRHLELTDFEFKPDLSVLGNLNKLESLFLELPPSVIYIKLPVNNLKSLRISGENIREISGFGKDLEHFDIKDCLWLREVPDITSCKNLSNFVIGRNTLFQSWESHLFRSTPYKDCGPADHQLNLRDIDEGVIFHSEDQYEEYFRARDRIVYDNNIIFRVGTCFIEAVSEDEIIFRVKTESIISKILVSRISLESAGFVKVLIVITFAGIEIRDPECGELLREIIPAPVAHKDWNLYSMGDERLFYYPKTVDDFPFFYNIVTYTKNKVEIRLKISDVTRWRHDSLLISFSQRSLFTIGFLYGDNILRFGRKHISYLCGGDNSSESYFDNPRFFAPERGEWIFFFTGNNLHFIFHKSNSVYKGVNNPVIPQFRGNYHESLSISDFSNIWAIDYPVQEKGVFWTEYDASNPSYYWGLAKAKLIKFCLYNNGDIEIVETILSENSNYRATLEYLVTNKDVERMSYSYLKRKCFSKSDEEVVNSMVLLGKGRAALLMDGSHNAVIIDFFRGDILGYLGEPYVHYYLDKNNLKLFGSTFHDEVIKNPEIKKIVSEGKISLEEETLTFKKGVWQYTRNGKIIFTQNVPKYYTPACFLAPKTILYTVDPNAPDQSLIFNIAWIMNKQFFNNSTKPNLKPLKVEI